MSHSSSFFLLPLLICLLASTALTAPSHRKARHEKNEHRQCLKMLFAQVSELCAGSCLEEQQYALSKFGCGTGAGLSEQMLKQICCPDFED